MPHLTKTSITSFLGHVLPLGLVSDTDLTNADIRWYASGDAVTVRSFNEGEYPSSRGVLLTLVKLGECDVHAEYLGKTYTAHVTVRERKIPDPETKFNYYIGDLHDHTSVIHKRAEFAERTCESHFDFIDKICKENKIDFTVMSDHGDVVTQRDFIAQALEYDAYEPKNVVILPGSESEVTLFEEDRLGVQRRNSGEIVMLNTNNFSEAKSWEEFYGDFRDTPLPLGTFAHPQVMGWGTGLWNHRPDINATPELKRIIKLTEMGDGSRRAQNLLHEYSYSLALDYGFRLSPTCSSDSHGPVWGYYACPGKTVIMAEEKSAEAFISAINDGRVYATESGNVKLRYTVNGKQAPTDISPEVTDYKVRVELGYFNDDPSTHPTRLEVISDFGACIYSTEITSDTLEFTLNSSTARYFYLRLIDPHGRKTWSAPTYLGRAPEVYDKDRVLTPMRKFHLTAYDEVSLTDAGTVFTDDPTGVWRAPEQTASLFIDLNNPHYVNAIGHLAETFVRDEIKAKHTMQGFLFAPFVAEYRISTSLDGFNFTTVKEGCIRIFGSEEILTFPTTLARFIRFEILSTVGARSGQDIFKNAKPSIAELTVFGT